MNRKGDAQGQTNNSRIFCSPTIILELENLPPVVVAAVDWNAEFQDAIEHNKGRTVGWPGIKQKFVAGLPV